MYAIYNITDGEVFRRYSALPSALQIGRRRVISPVAVGDEGTVNGKTYRLIQVVHAGLERPGEYFTRGDTSEAFDGLTTLTVTQNWMAWEQDEIDGHLVAQAEAADLRMATRKAYKAMFQIANEARTAGGKAPLTVQQFKTWLENL
jgi:hypothetical protein